MVSKEILVALLLCSLPWVARGAHFQDVTAVDVTSESPVVDLGYAKYRGAYSTADNISAFWGIRYAAPPLGNLRWVEPRPPIAESSVQNATTRPRHCLQAGNGVNTTNPFPTIAPRQNQPDADTEDCLFLNVHVPGKIQARQKLPVIVWIHGGGYTSMYPPQGDGADLVRVSQGQVVVVDIQYRLGIFGFLAGSRVKKNGSLNAGLLDQEFALKWVQKYIHLFGGNPTKVTIWGESAGAGSVFQQLVSRDGQQSPRLYRSAILSSSFLPSQYKYNDPVPEFIYQDLVNRVGCGTSPDTLACLRKTDIAKLQEANAAINKAGFYGTYVTVPVVDGTFITRNVTQLLDQHKLNTNSILAVTNTNEGVLFVDQNNPGTSASAYSRLLFPFLSEASAKRVEKVYASDGSVLASINSIQGDAIFRCPTYFLAESLQGKLHLAGFAIPPAGHGSDVPYYLPTGTGAPSFNNTLFIKSFSQSFLDFVLSGDPNVKFDAENITPAWPLWKEGHMQMVFNRTEDGKIDIRAQRTSPVLEERCRLWKELANQTAQ